jgi:hypothetical protein
MILKFESCKGEVYLVEATGNTGVAINKWSSLRKHIGINKFYRKCVYRRLEHKRDQDVMERLEAFLQQAVGQEYGLKVRDITIRRTTKNRTSFKNGDEEEKLIDENRTFFCSELVAKAYKILEVIENDEIPCSKYFPYHFS